METLKNKIILYLFIYSAVYFFYQGILISLFSQNEISGLLQTAGKILLFILSIYFINNTANITAKENIMFCWTLAFLYNPAIKSIQENGAGIIILFTISIIIFVITKINCSSIFTFILVILIILIISYLYYPINTLDTIIHTPYNQSIYNLLNVLHLNIYNLAYYIPLVLIIPFFLIPQSDKEMQIIILPVIGLLISFIAFESLYTILLITYIVLLSILQKNYRNNNIILILYFICYVIHSISFGIDNPLLETINILKPFIFIKLYGLIILYFLITHILMKRVKYKI